MTTAAAIAALAEIIAAEIPEVEDPADMAQLIVEKLKNAGYDIVAVTREGLS